MLKNAKLLALRAASGIGIERLMLNSGWRRNRLLILCYHGISLADEHEWNPSLYMPAPLLFQRFEILRKLDCAVLPLGEAVSRLYAGDLPPRSVAVTFDDGVYDFHARALPVIREFGFPVTVYFTTYYSNYNRPVFDVMCSYLLWKARGKRLDWPEVLPAPAFLDEAGRNGAYWSIRHRAVSGGLDGRQKDALLAALAARLEVDYEDICRKRILHLMTPEEARQAARAGVDLQLHTHRHRVSTNREFVEREIAENRAWIGKASSAPAEHFCYPGGCFVPGLADWLREMGVKSATTCEPGLASRSSDPMLLPRLVDTANTGDAVFRAWVAGTPAWLPRRTAPNNTLQIAEAESAVSEAQRKAYTGRS